MIPQCGRHVVGPDCEDDVATTKSLVRDAGVLADGAKTSGQPVTYNTGFGTTGRDWWYVSWVYTDSSTIYYSDPNNFRGAIDFMEKASKIAIPVGTSIAATVFGAVCTASTAGACGPAATAGWAAPAGHAAGART